MPPLSVDVPYVSLGSSFVAGSEAFDAFVTGAPVEAIQEDLPYLGNALSEFGKGFSQGTDDYAAAIAWQWQLSATHFGKGEDVNLRNTLRRLGNEASGLKNYSTALATLRGRIEGGQVTAPLFADAEVLERRMRRTSEPIADLGGGFTLIHNPLDDFRLTPSGHTAIKSFLKVDPHPHYDADLLWICQTASQRFTSRHSSLYEKFIALLYWLSYRHRQDSPITWNDRQEDVALELAQLLFRSDVGDAFRKFAADVLYCLGPSHATTGFLENLRSGILGLQKPDDALLKELIEIYANALHHLKSKPDVRFLFEIFADKSFSKEVRQEAFYYGAALAKELLPDGEKVVTEAIKKAAMDPENIALVEKAVQLAVDQRSPNFYGSNYKQTDLMGGAVRVLRNEIIPYYTKRATEKLEPVRRLTSHSALPAFGRYYRDQRVWISPWGEASAAQLLGLDSNADRGEYHRVAFELFKNTRLDTTVQMLSLLLWQATVDTVPEEKRLTETREVASLLVREMIGQPIGKRDYLLFAVQFLSSLGPVDSKGLLDFIYELKEAIHVSGKVKGVEPFILEGLVREYARRMKEYSKSLDSNQQPLDGLKWFLIDDVFADLDYPLSVRMAAYQSGVDLLFVLLGHLGHVVNDVVQPKIRQVLERDPALVALFGGPDGGAYTLDMEFLPRATRWELLLRERLIKDGRPAALNLLEDLPTLYPRSVKTGRFQVVIVQNELPRLTRGEQFWYRPKAALGRFFGRR